MTATNQPVTGLFLVARLLGPSAEPADPYESQDTQDAIASSVLDDSCAASRENEPR